MSAQLDSQMAMPPAGLARRLGAMVSDSLVVFALLALSTLIVFVPILGVLDKKMMAPAEVGWLLYLIYLLCMLGLWFGFYGYFCKRSGQTVGMRAWRIRVESIQGGLLDWQGALRRWLAAFIPWLPSLLTLGIAEQIGSTALKLIGEVLLLIGVAALLLMYWSPLRLTWHDRISRSRVIFLPKQ